MEFTDRYQALGIPYPDVATMCQGPCEGTGWVPVEGCETDPALLALWEAQHTFTCGLLGRLRNGVHAIFTLDRYRWSLAVDRCDGYHFVKCPDCGGSGKRA